MPNQLLYKNVRLCVTNGCPNNCSFCYRKPLDKSIDPIDMSEQVAFDAIKFIYRDIPKDNQFTLIPWGGEPLLRFKLISKIIDRFPQMPLHSNTSGSIMTQDMYDFLMTKGRNYFLVWSMGNAHEKYGGVRQKVEAQPLMARLVRERNFIINFTVTNYKNLVEDFDYLYEQGFDRVSVQQLLGYDFKEEELEVFMENLLTIIEKGRKNNRYPNMISEMNPLHNDSKNMVEKSSIWAKEFGPSWLVKRDNFCNSGLEKLFIDTAGNIWQCDGWYIARKNRLGSVYEGIDWSKVDTMQDIWGNQEKYMFQYCKDCNIQDVCPNTKCLATNYKFTGDIFKPYPGFCKFQKALVGMYKKYIDNRKREDSNAKKEPSAC
jgi:radical SAM protein with 4Fe4S-binding SPASM domain